MKSASVQSGCGVTRGRYLSTRWRNPFTTRRTRPSAVVTVVNPMGSALAFREIIPRLFDGRAQFVRDALHCELSKATLACALAEITRRGRILEQLAEGGGEFARVAR